MRAPAGTLTSSGPRSPTHVYPPCQLLVPSALAGTADCVPPPKRFGMKAPQSILGTKSVQLIPDTYPPHDRLGTKSVQDMFVIKSFHERSSGMNISHVMPS